MHCRLFHPTIRIEADNADRARFIAALKYMKIRLAFHAEYLPALAAIGTFHQAERMDQSRSRMSNRSLADAISAAPLK
jgi:hypothetical protein